MPAFIRSWATELGVVEYKLGPWSTKIWDSAYKSGQADYFKSLSERSRFSVIIRLLDDVILRAVTSGCSANILDVGCGSGVLFKHASHIEFSHWVSID